MTSLLIVEVLFVFSVFLFVILLLLLLLLQCLLCVVFVVVVLCLLFLAVVQCGGVFFVGGSCCKLLGLDLEKSTNSVPKLLAIHIRKLSRRLVRF